MQIVHLAPESRDRAAQLVQCTRLLAAQRVKRTLLLLEHAEHDGGDVCRLGGVGEAGEGRGGQGWQEEGHEE